MGLLKKRLPTLIGLVILSCLGFGLWWWKFKYKVNLTNEIKPIKIRITNVADTKFSVSWITTEKSVGMIEYGVVGQKLNQIADDDRGNNKYKVHHITISGLQPKTKYAFKIKSDKFNFDNQGRPYTTITKATTGEIPIAQNLYGQIDGIDGEGALVYLNIDGTEPISTLISSKGSYSLPITTIYLRDSNQYWQLNPDVETIAHLEIDNGVKTSRADLLINKMLSVPKIVIGQKYDFRNNGVEIAEVKPSNMDIDRESSATSTGETATIFNVEPLTTNEVTVEEKIQILNPSFDGEVITTSLPEFRGTAPANQELSIKLHAGVVYTGITTTDENGVWEWTPTNDLMSGESSIEVFFVDKDDQSYQATRYFKVDINQNLPAFEATPSSEIYANSSSSPNFASESSRVSMPTTESGVPVTGVMGYSLLTGLVGVVIMVLGSLMLVL